MLISRNDFLKWKRINRFFKEGNLIFVNADNYKQQTEFETAEKLGQKRTLDDIDTQEKLLTVRQRSEKVATEATEAAFGTGLPRWVDEFKFPAFCPKRLALEAIQQVRTAYRQPRQRAWRMRRILSERTLGLVGIATEGTTERAEHATAAAKGLEEAIKQPLQMLRTYYNLERRDGQWEEIKDSPHLPEPRPKPTLEEIENMDPRTRLAYLQRHGALAVVARGRKGVRALGQLGWNKEGKRKPGLALYKRKVEIMEKSIALLREKYAKSAQSIMDRNSNAADYKAVLAFLTDRETGCGLDQLTAENFMAQVTRTHRIPSQLHRSLETLAAESKLPISVQEAESMFLDRLVGQIGIKRGFRKLFRIEAGKSGQRIIEAKENMERIEKGDEKLQKTKAMTENLKERITPQEGATESEIEVGTILSFNFHRHLDQRFVQEFPDIPASVLQNMEVVSVDITGGQVILRPVINGDLTVTLDLQKQRFRVEHNSAPNSIDIPLGYLEDIPKVVKGKSAAKEAERSQFGQILRDRIFREVSAEDIKNDVVLEFKLKKQPFKNICRIFRDIPANSDHTFRTQLRVYNGNRAIVEVLPSKKPLTIDFQRGYLVANTTQISLNNLDMSTGNENPKIIK